MPLATRRRFAGTTLDEPTMEETLTRVLTAKQS